MATMKIGLRLRKRSKRFLVESLSGLGPKPNLRVLEVVAGNDMRSATALSHVLLETTLVVERAEECQSFVFVQLELWERNVGGTALAEHRGHEVLHVARADGVERFVGQSTV